MTNAIKIYKEIISDFNKPENAGYSLLNRSILLKNKIRIVFIVTAESMQRIVAVMLPNDCKKEPLSKFPKWHGIEFAYDKIREYKNANSENEYIIISQSKDYDSGIFEIVADDIANQLDKVNVQRKMIECLFNTLVKWKKFFSLNSEIIMSEQMQEGLYGELLVLEKLINSFGEQAAMNWSGADRETHDFYINGSAVEVKTTSLKSTEKIKVSSEHQLNPNDVDRVLVLYVNMVRKSRVDGENLPDIINRIADRLSESVKTVFFDKLLQYGYIPACEDKYILGFHLRSYRVYNVYDDFPNIIPDELNRGVSEVTYSLDLNACSEFEIEWESAVKNLEGGSEHGNQ